MSEGRDVERCVHIGQRRQNEGAENNEKRLAELTLWRQGADLPHGESVVMFRFAAANSHRY